MIPVIFRGNLLVVKAILLLMPLQSMKNSLPTSRELSPIVLEPWCYNYDTLKIL
jgi:hypothetical protein